MYVYIIYIYTLYTYSCWLYTHVICIYTYIHTWVCLSKDVSFASWQWGIPLIQRLGLEKKKPTTNGGWGLAFLFWKKKRTTKFGGGIYWGHLHLRWLFFKRCVWKIWGVGKGRKIPFSNDFVDEWIIHQLGSRRDGQEPVGKWLEASEIKRLWSTRTETHLKGAVKKKHSCELTLTWQLFHVMRKSMSFPEVGSVCFFMEILGHPPKNNETNTCLTPFNSDWSIDADSPFVGNLGILTRWSSVSYAEFFTSGFILVEVFTWEYLMYIVTLSLLGNPTNGRYCKLIENVVQNICRMISSAPLSPTPICWGWQMSSD